MHALVDTMAETEGVMESIIIDPDQDERVRHSAMLFAVSAAQSRSVEYALVLVERIEPTLQTQ